MKNTEKITASEMRTLWGSRVVIWITMILVLFPVVNMLILFYRSCSR